tara:strand:- start:63 stop:1424 length:1362 start_codon:yes stop_codon:yes gene_type:complete
MDAMTERVEFNNKGHKVHYTNLNLIAKEFAKLLLSSEKRISNPRKLSNEACITILQRFRDVYKAGRQKIFENVELAEKEWRKYLIKIKEKVPPPGSENVPEGLVGYRKKDLISLENVGIISDMIEKDVGGFFFVSKTTPELVVGALLFDERRIDVGFRNIDMRIQDLINEWLPAKLVLSGELQHQGACLGVYALDKVQTANGKKVRTAHGREVWRHELGDLCIAKISGGNWAVQKEEHVGVNDSCVLRSRHADIAFLHLSDVAWWEESDDAWRAVAGLKCAGIEEQTPVLSTTAVSTGQAAAGRGGSSTKGGGKMPPTTGGGVGGVAPSLQQGDNPTGHTSSTKRKLQEEGEGQNAWYHHTKAARLVKACLLVKEPHDFLTELEGFRNGEFSKELLKAGGIVETIRWLEAGDDQAIANRATALRKKWWQEEVERRQNISRTGSLSAQPSGKKP